MKEAEYYLHDETEGLNKCIQDKTEGLTKRIDDAFTELDTHRHRMNGLTREGIELKHELLRLREEYKFKSLILRIILGVMSFLWIVQIIFDICISE